jgi:hypothetical protein
MDERHCTNRSQIMEDECIDEDEEGCFMDKYKSIIGKGILQVVLPKPQKGQWGVENN